MPALAFFPLSRLLKLIFSTPSRSLVLLARRAATATGSTTPPYRPRTSRTGHLSHRPTKMAPRQAVRALPLVKTCITLPPLLTTWVIREKMSADTKRPVFFESSLEKRASMLSADIRSLIFLLYDIVVVWCVRISSI